MDRQIQAPTCGPAALIARPGVFALAQSTPLTHSQRRRALRVWVLVATIVVLSLSDLYMTLAHLRSVGMGEANPLARIVISYNSPALLSAWKCSCVALAAMILILARFQSRKPRIGLAGADMLAGCLEFGPCRQGIAAKLFAVLLAVDILADRFEHQPMRRALPRLR